MRQPVLRRRGFTLVELLVVIAIISIIAGLVIPGIVLALEEARKAQCTNNLRAIHSAAFLYARKGNVFPLASGRRPRAHESLNVLLESRYGDGLEPRHFVCPASGMEPALLADGTAKALEGPSEFVLAEETCSYAFRDTRTGLSRSGILASDKYHDGYEDGDGVHAGHRGCLMVVYINGSTEELETDHPQLTDEKLPPGVAR